MASSSSSPSWVILGRIPIVDDDPFVNPPPGFERDLCFSLSPAPCVSHVTIPMSLFPEVITHQDRNNPSILAVDPSGGILLLHAILRRASADHPVTIDRPGHQRSIVQSGLVASYFVLDSMTKSAHALPQPGILKIPANVGILYSPSSTGRYVVAELRPIGSNDAVLTRFTSHEGFWVKKRAQLPVGRFKPDCVLSHNRMLWWVDLSYGLVACNPFTEAPAFSFVQLPPGKAIKDRGAAGVLELDRYRCVRVSNGKLRFVDMYTNNTDRHGARKVSVWTLQADRDSTSSEWSLEYEASFVNIWAHGSYSATGLPKKVPVLALIHPKNPWIVYFFLDKHLFGINLCARSLIEVDSYQPVALSSDLISSRFFHAWELPPALSAFSAQREFRIGSDEVMCIGQNFIKRSYIDQQFFKLYGQLLHRGPGAPGDAYSGENGQTMACASQALKHWNTSHNTAYEIDVKEHMDSNSFDLTEGRRFGIQMPYFHVNFRAKYSSGQNQLFFAELNGQDGPDNTITVTTLGHDENEIPDSSGEHICLCCTGLMHPYSTSFAGREGTGTH